LQCKPNSAGLWRRLDSVGVEAAAERLKTTLRHVSLCWGRFETLGLKGLLPPKPGVHATFARDHEYKLHGTGSLLAGIDLAMGEVHALVKERHRSREFIEFLKLLDAAYPASTAIKLIIDNHSAYISKETEAWLATQPEGRFTFVFTPKHGFWLNLVEGFFSKLARSVVRPKQELEDRILAAIDDINRHPIVHTWSYELDEAA
jgi:transposase